jgi:hypothetical protein
VVYGSRLLISGIKIKIKKKEREREPRGSKAEEVIREWRKFHNE